MCCDCNGERRICCPDFRSFCKREIDIYFLGCLFTQQTTETLFIKMKKKMMDEPCRQCKRCIMDCFLHCLVAGLITKLFQMKVVGQCQQKPTTSGADLVGLPRINLLFLLLFVVMQSVDMKVMICSF